MLISEFNRGFVSSEWRFSYTEIQLAGYPMRVLVKKDKSQILIYTDLELEIKCNIVVYIRKKEDHYEFEAKLLHSENNFMQIGAYQAFNYLKDNDRVFLEIIKAVEERSDDESLAIW